MQTNNDEQDERFSQPNNKFLAPNIQWKNKYSLQIPTKVLDYFIRMT